MVQCFAIASRQVPISTCPDLHTLCTDKQIACSCTPGLWRAILGAIAPWLMAVTPTCNRSNKCMKGIDWHMVCPIPYSRLDHPRRSVDLKLHCYADLITEDWRYQTQTYSLQCCSRPMKINSPWNQRSCSFGTGSSGEGRPMLLKTCVAPWMQSIELRSSSR